MNEVQDKVSREVYQKLLDYHELLLKWNKTINLISVRNTDEVWQRHILDSLQLLKYIENKNISIVDIGSGAGFPGVILSIAGIKKVTLIESDSRKSAFLLQAGKLSCGEIEIINDRAENIKGLKCDIITSRACAELIKIFDLTRNIEGIEKYLLHKGRSYEKEIILAKKHWLFNSKVHDSITSHDGKILEITNVTNI